MPDNYIQYYEHYIRYIFFIEAIFESGSLDELLRNWDLSLPATLGYSHLNATARGDITQSINEFYFGNEATPTNPIDIQTLMNVSERKC